MTEWLAQSAARAALAAKPQAGPRLNDLLVRVRGVVHIRDAP